MRWTFVAVALALTAGRVQAQSSSFHVTLTGDVAATDNSLSTPDNPQSDLYFQLRPGLLYTHQTRRVEQELSLDAEILEYVIHSESPSVTEHLKWRALFQPAPLYELATSLAIGTGKINAIEAATAADQVQTGLLPIGPVEEHTLDADEFLSKRLSDATRVTETAIAHYIGTVDTTSTHTHATEIGMKLGFEYVVQSWAFIAEGAASYISLDRYAPQIPPGPDGSRDDKQIDPRATLTARRDLTRYWSASLSGGVEYVIPVGSDKYDANDVQKSGLFPLVTGSLAYTDLFGRFALQAGHVIAPNLAIAQNTETTNVLAQLALPLPWLDDSRRREPKLVAVGTLGFDHTTLINTDTTSEPAGSYNVFHADVGVAYTPRRGMTYGLRYEFYDQTGNSTALQTLAGFRRNTVFLTFAIRYPDRLAVVVPHHDTVRADHKDVQLGGEDQVVPDNPNEADR